MQKRFAWLTTLIMISLTPLSALAQEPAAKAPSEKGENGEKGEQKRPKPKRSFNSLSPNVPGSEPDTAESRGKADSPRGQAAGSRDN